MYICRCSIAFEISDFLDISGSYCKQNIISESIVPGSNEPLLYVHVAKFISHRSYSRFDGRHHKSSRDLKRLLKSER